MLTLTKGMTKCRKCGKDKEPTEDKGAYKSWCNKCVTEAPDANKARHKEQHIKNGIDWTGTKKCSRCGDEQAKTEFHKNILSPDGTCSACKECLNKILREKKQRMVDYKGGKCIQCGYDKCDAALEFHHLNPKEKDKAFGGISSRSWEKTMDELDKCALLCANCHREVHAGISALD